jgi:hypothetical protein
MLLLSCGFISFFSCSITDLNILMIFLGIGGGKSYNSKCRKGGTMRKLSIIMLIVTALSLCSCFYIRVDYAALEGMAPMGDFRKVVPFMPGGTLSLESANGNIEIQGWEKEEVEVYAKKMFRLPDQPKLLVYPWRDFGPQIDFDEFENFIKIRTTNISKENPESMVDFYVNVPHSINLRDVIAQEGDIFVSDLYGDVYVDLTSGNVVIENFSGSLTASVTYGSVSASLYDLRREDEVIITVNEGDVIVSLEENAQAHLEASFPKGEVFNDFESDPSTEPGKLKLELGENGAFLSLTALNGDVRIKRIKTDEMIQGGEK